MNSKSKFHGHIVGGKLALPDPIKQLRQRYLDALPEGTAVCETIERVGTPRTHQQLKAFFGMVITAAKEYFDEIGMDCMGVPLNKEQVKDLLYHFCGAVGDNGERIRLSKPMTTIQAAQFFENCRNWLAKFGVVIPDPNPAWREQEKDK